MSTARKLLIISIVSVVVVGLAVIVMLAQQRQLIGSGATGNGDEDGPSNGSPTSCPSGTTVLFSSSGSLSVGQRVNGNGEVKSMDGSWIVGSRDGVPMAEGGKKIRVQFPQNVNLVAALIYDNDPKSGEQPWSINGRGLPTTNNNTWASASSLNIEADYMEFDNGGDSPHFNVCISTVQPTPSPSPIPTVTSEPSPTPIPSVTPTGTLIPTLSPTVTVMPSPTDCPLPEKPAVEILCQGCTSI